jgi:peptide/nickel transport system permease protein
MHAADGRIKIVARFVLRRIVHAVVLVFITIAITFFAIHLAPGDPLSRYYSPDIDPGAMEQVRVQLGLDDPVYVQFGRWLWSFVRGDFGMSLSEHRPVGNILRETIPRTVKLTVIAFVVQLMVGLGIGIVAAWKRSRAPDRILTLAALVIYAVPAFYLAYLLIMFFSLQLDWLPTSGLQSIGIEGASRWELFSDRFAHLVLPVLVLGVASAAGLARYTRGSVLEAIGQDYIRTARAKGVPEGKVVWWHAFRNALPPILTVVGLSVPFLLGGAVVVEKVFAWPGMGSLFVDSIFARDYPVVLAVNFVAACMVIAGNFLADVSYMLADPRIKLASSGRTPEGA